MEAWWFMNVAAFCVLALSSLGAGSRSYVLEFSSQSCGPCQQVAPVVSKLEREGLPIRSVDVNDDRAMAEQYEVTSIPTFVVVVNGKEVERMSGVQSEGRIRQMLARIPRPERAASNDRWAVELGEPAPLPRPQVVVPTERRQPPASSEIVVAERGDKPKGLWPFKPTKKSSLPAEVRGNNPGRMPDVGALSPAEAPAPMDASVRIRVLTGNSVVKGSGTVIESVTGRATILTCSHICRGANEGTKVEVDLFRDGKPTTILAKIIGTDPVADVAIISLPCDQVLPASPVGALTQSPGVGDKVVGIGCSGGAEPSREQLRVKDVNKFDGPPTLTCTGIPAQGRSGGGLFDENGTLVGVCFAADADENKRPNGGVYCGLKPVHELLTKHELARLIPSDAEDSALAVTEPDHSPAEWPGKAGLVDSAPMSTAPVLPPEDASIQPSTMPLTKTPAAEEFAADDAEVVVIIRSRSAGTAGDKVILIHKPSRKFLQFVEGEVSADAGASAPMTRHSAAPPAEMATERMARVKPSTKLLLPTGLKTKRDVRQ